MGPVRPSPEHALLRSASPHSVSTHRARAGSTRGVDLWGYRRGPPTRLTPAPVGVPHTPARAAPWLISLFVNDVPQIIETARILRLSIGQPRLTALPAFPRASSKAEDFGFHAAALQRARQDIGGDGSDL